MRRILIAIVCVACVACSGGSKSPTPVGPAGGEGVGGEGGGGAEGGGAVTTEQITDDEGRVYTIDQGVKGAPAEVGCSDGQREAFVDAAAYPRIAGCLAAWQDTKSMRAPSSGAACGDDGSECAVPADACGPGWHVCGAPDGKLSDLTQITAEQCENAGGGRFSAGISHCEKQDGCEYDTGAEADYECFESGWCSESVCCGRDCGEFGACVDGVWPGKTHIAQGTDQGCGATSSRRAGGVLCCR
jgi:hypothetical protein